MWSKSHVRLSQSFGATTHLLINSLPNSGFIPANTVVGSVHEPGAAECGMKNK